MFNQFGQSRPFTPQTPQRPLAGQTPSASNSSFQASYGAQITPDFMRPSSTAPSQQGPTRMARIKPDSFGQMSPQNQRAALYDQARQQATQAHQTNYQTLRNPSSALPGGLTERQKADFQLLQRTNPVAAQQQLAQYQRTADIRYNKPQPGGTQSPAGPNYRSTPTNFNGPRPRFGS